MCQVRKKTCECLSQESKQPGRTNAFTLEIFSWVEEFILKSLSKVLVSFRLQLHAFMTACKQQTALLGADYLLIHRV